MADYTSRLRVELSGAKDYKEGLDKIGKAAKASAKEQTLLNAQIASGGRTLETDARQRELLNARLAQQKEKVELVRRELEKSRKATGDTSDSTRKLTNDYNVASAQLLKAEKALKDFDKTAMDSNGIRAFSERVRQMTKDAPAWMSNLEGVGKSLTKSVSAPLAALGVAAGKSYVELEDQIYTVATIADTASRSLDDLTQDALEASQKSGMAAKDIAAGMYGAISAGVDTALSGQFTGLAAMAAKAGLTDVATAVDGATSAINAWKIGYENAETVFDRFIVAQNLGKTTVGEMAQSIGQVTGVAPQVGVSLSEVLAATAALTKNGVQTASAMNGLKAVMQGVIKPTADAQKLAKKLRLEFSASALAQKGFTGFLADVMAKTRGDSEQLAKLFGSVEGLSKVMLLGGSAAEDYAAALSAMGDSAGTLQEAFDTKTASNAERMKLAVNSLRNSGIQLGQSLTPAIEGLSNGMTDAATWLANLNEEQMQSVVRFGLMAVALGPVTVGFTKLYRAGQLASGALRAMGMPGGTLLLCLGAAAALGAGIAALNRHFDSLQGVNKLDAAFDSLCVDTSSVDSAVASASALVDELNLYSEAIRQFETVGEDIEETIATYFGRKQVTAAARKTFKEDVRAWIAPLLEDGKNAVSEETQQLAAALETASNEYTNYALKLAQTSRTPTEAQLEQLEALKQKIIEIGNEIMTATNQSVLAAEVAYTRATHGSGTAGDYAIAAAYVQTRRESALQEAKKAHGAPIANAQKALVEAGRGTDAKAYAEAEAALAQAEADFAEAQAQANEEAARSANVLAKSLMAQYPEAAEAVQELTRLQNAYEALQAYAETDPDTVDLEAWTKGVHMAYEAVMDQALETTPMQGIVEAMEAAKEKMTEMAEEVQKGELKTLLSSLYSSVGSGLLTYVEDNAVGDALRALLTVVDLTDDGQTLGEQILSGEVQGLSGDAARTQMVRHAEEVIAAAREAYDTHSPSKVFETIGRQLLQGEAAGIRFGSAEVKRVLQAHISELTRELPGQMYAAGLAAGRALASAMQQAGSLPSVQLPGSVDEGGGRKVAPQIQVNYTGSVSARDSRLLGQQIARALG